MSALKKIIPKSNSHQIKLEQKKLTYGSLKKIWDWSSIDWVAFR